MAALLVVLVAGFAPPILARTGPLIDGHDLLHMCTAVASDRDGDERYAACEKNVERVREILQAQVVHGYRACVPKAEITLRLVFSVIRWMEQNPQLLDRNIDDVMAQAFAERWPCTDSQTKRVN